MTKAQFLCAGRSIVGTLSESSWVLAGSLS